CILIRHATCPLPALRSSPTRRSSDLQLLAVIETRWARLAQDHGRRDHRSGERSAPGLVHPSDHALMRQGGKRRCSPPVKRHTRRSEEHTSELQSRENLVCRLLLVTKT